MQMLGQHRQLIVFAKFTPSLDDDALEATICHLVRAITSQDNDFVYGRDKQPTVSISPKQKRNEIQQATVYVAIQCRERCEDPLHQRQHSVLSGEIIGGPTSDKVRRGRKKVGSH